MRVFTGTSGFSYKQWKGSFYPEDLAQEDWLAHYATRLPAVEVNNTFYRLPRASVMESWAASVPADFRFAVKASQRITHRARLKACGELLGVLERATDPLGETRGPFLFQLPPNFRKDTARLEEFLVALGGRTRAAFEFRHPSWDDEETRDVLRRAGAALVAADGEEESGAGAPESIALHPTADFGYLRLRRTAYDEAALDAWAERLRQEAWDEVHVFFKHEDGALGPAWAAALGARLRRGG